VPAEELVPADVFDDDYLWFHEEVQPTGCAKPASRAWRRSTRAVSRTGS
jgi:hypothetical protein